MQEEEQITISGVPPQYDAAECAERQQRHVKSFLETSQSCYRLVTPLLSELMNEYAILYAEGYRLGKYPITTNPAMYTALLTQPEEVLAPQIKVIEAEVKASYVAELKAEHERYKQLLIAQLKQTDNAKTQKAQEAKEAKRQAAYEAQVDACYEALSVPE